MAEFLIIAVKDSVTEEVMQPIFVHNQEEGKRFFKHQLENNPFWKGNEEQFTLLDLGLFDSNTGNIIGNDEPGSIKDVPIIHPEIICKGTDLIRKE